jgi:hypothetical protein
MDSRFNAVEAFEIDQTIHIVIFSETFDNA